MKDPDDSSQVVGPMETLNPTRHRFVWVDPLRWALASLVFLHHAYGSINGYESNNTPASLKFLASQGYLAVDAFFIIAVSRSH